MLAYFAHHAYQGRLGIFAKADLDRKAVILAVELEKLQGNREKLETRVALLRPGTMEKDMLDEQARYHLNLAREEEIVIFKSRYSD